MGKHHGIVGNRFAYVASGPRRVAATIRSQVKGDGSSHKQDRAYTRLCHGPALGSSPTLRRHV